MDSALSAVRRYCREAEVAVDRVQDPNETCLIGPEWSELMTSLGQVEAKRTTTAPDMAGLLVRLLSEAGVQRGDTVAIGASGSFPGFLVATLAAVKALEASPVTILSLGASSYGATRPDFNLLDLYQVLENAGLAPGPPAAVSLGGAGDTGEDFDPEFREELLEKVLRRRHQPDPRSSTGSGEAAAGDTLRPERVPLIRDPDLAENVRTRMEFYGVPAVFVNLGGAEVNLGTHPMILQVPPGLVPSGGSGLPGLDPGAVQPEQRGVVLEMMIRGIPVIHLLHVRGLSLRYGLPWDPVPLPPPGSTRLSDTHRGTGPVFWILTLLYLGGLVLLAFYSHGRPATPGRETVRQPG